MYTFVLTLNVGIFYFILAWRGLKSTKLKKMFFFTSSNKFAIQNNPLLQLLLIFLKTVKKYKLEVCKFQIHRLSSFSAIKKTVTGVEGGGGPGGWGEVSSFCS